ncbi:MAG: outer membrane beta-barrel protein [Bacteroidaceae bacterium]
MKKEDDNWTKAFRERLKNYSEPIPANGWDALEKELTSSPMLVPSHTSYSFRRWIAAAVIFVAVASTLTFWFLQTPTASYVQQLSSNPSTHVTDPKIKVEPIPTHTLVAPKLIAKVEKTNRKTAVGEQLTETTKPTVQENSGNSAEQQTIAKQQTSNAEKKQETTSSTVDKSSKRSLAPDNEYRSLRTKKAKTWSVGMMVGNSASATNTGKQGFGSLSNSNERTVLSSSFPMGLHSQVLLNNIDKPATTDIKHRMPISFGASFRFHLSPMFALETGLVYTKLSSELRGGTQTDYYNEEQTLHYLGVPLKGTWMFLNKKLFSLYWSAGGMVEKCVSGKSKIDYMLSGKETDATTSNLRVKPLQWSVNTAVGAQFNATKHLGIFAEPGIIYYFNDGSPIATIRKDKPFNFNLQMGVRFTY